MLNVVPLEAETALGSRGKMVSLSKYKTKFAKPSGIIPLDIFNLNVAVFHSEPDRISGLTGQGCNDLSEHSPAALASAHRDFTVDGEVRFSMVIKPGATKATWAHECVHIADFVIDYLALPTSIKGTEVRAYMVGHLFSHLQKIMRKTK